MLVEKYIIRDYIPEDFDFSTRPATPLSVFCNRYQQEFRINYPKASKKEIHQLLKDAYNDILEVRPSKLLVLQKKASEINKKQCIKNHFYDFFSIPLTQ
jgi:hypothetical protein